MQTNAANIEKTPEGWGAREYAVFSAAAAGRNDHWNRDPRRTYADAKLQATYDNARSLAAADDRLDADTEWDSDA